MTLHVGVVVFALLLAMTTTTMTTSIGRAELLLESLEVPGLVLSPSFSPSVLSYTAKPDPNPRVEDFMVPLVAKVFESNMTTAVSVHGTVTYPQPTPPVTDAASGGKRELAFEFPVFVGSATLKVELWNGTAVETAYQVQVNRLSYVTQLMSITPMPPFSCQNRTAGFHDALMHDCYAPKERSYHIVVGAGQDASVALVAAHDGARMSYCVAHGADGRLFKYGSIHIGTFAACDSPRTPVELASGEQIQLAAADIHDGHNVIIVKVEAEDTRVSDTYNFDVVRDPCPNNCTSRAHGTCSYSSFSCNCLRGYMNNVTAGIRDCSLRDPSAVQDPKSKGWWMTALLVVAAVAAVICVERCYTSCRKVYIRKTRGLGFQQLPMISASLEDSDEEYNGSFDMDDLGDLSDDPEPARHSRGRRQGFEDL